MNKRIRPLLIIFTLALFGGGAFLRACNPPTPPPPDTELGSFRVECDFSHRKLDDPIVAPGGNASHLHDFFGNPTTNRNSTYQSMVAASSTTCGAAGDKAGYWIPTLYYSNGNPVPVRTTIFYYRNRPVDNPTGIVPFPKDLRMIAGGANLNTDYVYWTCDGESDTGFSARKGYIPNCGSAEIKNHIWFPSCWDGKRLDSPDHRAHMAYGINDDGEPDPTDPDECPSTHPVKVPQIDFRIQYRATNGTGMYFSDMTTLPHSDFWNTWDQSQLTKWINECLKGEGQSCGEATGTL